MSMLIIMNFFISYSEVLGENEVKPKQTSEKEPRPLTPEAARAESKTRT